VKLSDVTKTSCKLTWKAPQSDGGSAVTGYYVEKFTGSKWIKAIKKPVTSCSLDLDDLLEGSDNELRVCAENAAGVGEPSESTGKFVAKDPFEVCIALGFRFYIKLAILFTQSPPPLPTLYHPNPYPTPNHPPQPVFL